MGVYVLLNTGQVLCAALSKSLKIGGLLFHLTRDFRVPLWIPGLGPITLRISHLILRRLKKAALPFDIAVADGSLAVVIPLADRAEKLFQDATTARAESRPARQFGNERSIGYGDVFHDSSARSPISRSQDASVAAG
jgi:hypothetical protein